jgi:A/G-specific adenine glycosylase
VPAFVQKLILWQRRHGRHDLPWQGTRDPYRIWLSEVMLQQTQVSAVIPYYERFLSEFPDVATLAAAPEDSVLRVWSGLGYYARGRNLHAAAKRIAALGAFPRDPEAIAELPGIGRSTAAAIAAFAFGRSGAILDGNVKRVLARRFGVEGEKAQWALAERLLPSRDIRVYTQGLMDLGATVCVRRNPACERCPLARDCVARREGRIDELPAPRKRKALPLRRATWLVLLHRGEVLLERRPAPGLWGGLWTFPEGASGARARAENEKRFGCTIAAERRLPKLTHGFTHFQLEAQPVRLDVGGLASRTRGGQTWLGVAEAARAAVPTPVRRLLLSLVL